MTNQLVKDFQKEKQVKDQKNFPKEFQNENLNKDTFLGTISPVTGFMITENNAAYGYTGIKAFYNLGQINFTPSFPGFSGP